MFLASNSELSVLLSSPLVTIIGLIEFLVNSISIDFIVNGLKFSIFGYISRGDIVPDVNITEA